MEGIAVLGSTGTIGVNTLAVVRQNRHRYTIDGLSCHHNIELLAEQIREFSPKRVAVAEGKGDRLKSLIKDVKPQPKIWEGIEGLRRLATAPDVNKIVAAVVGAAGIEPVMAGIKAGKAIALANKESMVTAGPLLMTEARRHSVPILPIDSEHNAIFQSLHMESTEAVDHITLTASGGPFLRTPLSQFRNISPADALKHPNWAMGRKITIDSATMMNKCLEIIEAKWLFDLPPEKIKVLIHPQSIVHSMVTFRDGSTICQMGVPDMRIPIAHCLSYPERIQSGCGLLDLAAVSSLTFEYPDLERFPALNLAYQALALGGGAPAALNGANEVLVSLFLERSIHFLEITEILKALIHQLETIDAQSGKTGGFPRSIGQLEDTFQADRYGREFVSKTLNRR